MISILIPIYNYVIIDLVKSIHCQILNTDEEFEIILIDDCSQEEYKTQNKECALLRNTSYFELAHNIGRAKIRNELAKKAQYPYLLFIDCDAKIDNPTYISNYIKECKKQEQIVCGGVKYENRKPQIDKILRWKYGHKREMKTAQQRSLSPNKSFTPFNFLISKELFTNTLFDETITEYGHEDTLFGFLLKQKNITIKHIDNPLIHCGIETNAIFLDKTKESIQSLVKIYNQNNKEFANEIKLIKVYSFFKNIKLLWLINLLFTLSRRVSYNILLKCPYLFLFDWYKLGYFTSFSLNFSKGIQDH